jgi:hypothetical protein
MTAFFVIQVALLWGFWTWLFGKRTGAGLAVFLGLTGLAAWSGLLRFGAMPPRLPLLLVPTTLVTIWLARSLPTPQTPVAWLIGYQGFRVLVEIFLWWGHREGIVPVQMTWEGRNFDVLTGLTALPVAWLAARRLAPPVLIQAWNIMGLALLMNVVTVAILSMPTPWQRFHPAVSFVTEAPFIWLPLFLVQSALFGHVAILFAGRRTP